MKLDSEQWQRVSAILDEAFGLPPDQVGAFVEKACAGDATVFAAVNEMLAADAGLGDFLSAPAAECAAELILGTQDSQLDSASFGPYRTTGILGYGGMGVVYSAERNDGAYEHQVAIKCLRALSNTPELQARLREERQILAQLQHPSIAYLLDGGVTENGLPYIVMEQVDGVSFIEFSDGNSLSIKNRLRLFLNVCEGVSYAHNKLVVHRDLKPSNILVVNPNTSRSGANHLQVKLLDFGIARFLEQEIITQATDPELPLRSHLLTPEYAAPEQLRREPVTTAVDVYSLGLLLYQLLCGNKAHNIEGMSIRDAIERVCEQVPPRPSESLKIQRSGSTGATSIENTAKSRATSGKRLIRTLDGDLDTIVMKALQKSPSDRYSSVEELSSDVSNYLIGAPLNVRKNDRPYVLGKLIKQYRWAVISTALIITLLAGFALVSVRSNIQIRGALEQARAEKAKAVEISQFLHQLFELADPFAPDNAPVSVSELLARGVERVSDDLSGQPETQSHMLFELARIHNSLGEYETAADLVAQSLAIQKSILGERSPDVAGTLHWQSIIADNLGQYDESERLAEQALELRLAVLDSSDPGIGESMDRLASLLAYTGQKDRAVELSMTAVRILDAAVGEEDKRTQTARHNLAWMLGYLGRYEEAVPVYEQVLAISSRTSGSEHPETLETLNNFAVMLRHQGELIRAEQIYRQVLESRIKVLGSSHPQVGFSLNNLAKLLHDKGEFAEATELYLKSLEILKLRYGEEHSNIAISLTNLAQVQHEQGMISEAESNFRQSLAIHRKVTPKNSPKIASAMQGLGYLLSENRNQTEAELLLRESLLAFEQALDPGHRDIAETQLRLAQLLAAAGSSQESSELLGLSLPVLVDRLADDHWLVLQAKALQEALSTHPQ